MTAPLSSPPGPDEKEVPLTDALVSGLRKLGLHQADITAEDVIRALSDHKKKTLLTPREAHAIAMTFTEIDVDIFDDGVAAVPPGGLGDVIRGLAQSALRQMHERGIGIFGGGKASDRPKK